MIRRPSSKCRTWRRIAFLGATLMFAFALAIFTLVAFIGDTRSESRIFVCAIKGGPCCILSFGKTRTDDVTVTIVSNWPCTQTLVNFARARDYHGWYVEPVEFTSGHMSSLLLADYVSGTAAVRTMADGSVPWAPIPIGAPSVTSATISYCSIYTDRSRLLSLAALFAAIWMCMALRGTLRVLRKRRKRYIGRCPHCAYDLRASQVRCPECWRTVHSFGKSCRKAER